MMNFGALWPIWPEAHDRFAIWVQCFIFEEKSWRLFSFLFGFGFALQMLRAEARGARFLPIYVRRLIILFLIGVGHTLFYDGDILKVYALLGFVLLAFRSLSTKTVIIGAFMLLLIHPVDRAVSPILARPTDPETALQAQRQTRERSDVLNDFVQQDHRAYAEGPMRDIFTCNAWGIPYQLFPLGHLRGSESWVTFFAMFLLGLYVGRWRIFHDVTAHRVLIRRVLWWGMALGLTAMTADWVLRDIWTSPPMPRLTRFIGNLLWAYGATVFR